MPAILYRNGTSYQRTARVLELRIKVGAVWPVSGHDADRFSNREERDEPVLSATLIAAIAPIMSRLLGAGFPVIARLACPGHAVVAG